MQLGPRIEPGRGVASKGFVMAAAHLIGAFGLHWRHDEVSWDSKPGGTWQLLGHRGTYLPGLSVCDFRRARGVYLLHDEYGVNCVGLARGRHGIGSRLREHHAVRRNWSRFSWFAFDDVTAKPEATGWAQVSLRDEAVVTI